MKTPLTLSRVRYTFFAAAARHPASPETAQYPVMEPPRPRTSPTQNHAYTSAVKSAPTPICARESSRKREGEGRRFRRHPSVDFGRRASRESRAREDGRRARDREGKTRGGLRAHLGHRQVHATLPLRLQHLNLPLRRLEHRGKPARANTTGTARGQSRGSTDRARERGARRAEEGARICRALETTRGRRARIHPARALRVVAKTPRGARSRVAREGRRIRRSARRRGRARRGEGRASRGC